MDYVFLCDRIHSVISLETQFSTKFFSRGVPRIGSSPALGGGLEISALGWSAGFHWMESNGGDGGDGSAFLGYHYPLGIIDIGAGLYGSWVTNGRYDDTLEAYISIATDPLLFGLRPSTIYYVRLDEARGGYGEVKIDRLWRLAHDRLDLAPYAVFGFGDYYSSAYGANHFEVGLGAAWHLSRHLMVEGQVAWIAEADGAKTKVDRNSDVTSTIGLRYRF